MNAHEPLFPTGRGGNDVTCSVRMRAASGHHAGPDPALLGPVAIAAKILSGWRSRRVLGLVPGPPLHVVGPSHTRKIRLYRAHVATQANLGPKMQQRA